MVLCDNFDGEMMFEYIDIRVFAHLANKALLYFVTGVVGMVEDAEFAVPPFAVKVEIPIVVTVEINSPANQFADLFGRFGDYFSNGFRVAKLVAGNHSVFEMFVEVVDFEISD